MISTVWISYQVDQRYHFVIHVLQKLSRYRFRNAGSCPLLAVNKIILYNCVKIFIAWENCIHLAATRYQSLFLPVVLIYSSWQYSNLLGHNLILVTAFIFYFAWQGLFYSYTHTYIHTHTYMYAHIDTHQKYNTLKLNCILTFIIHDFNFYCIRLSSDNTLR